MRRLGVMLQILSACSLAAFDTVFQANRNIPIIDSADVIVVGGTTGGISAAVQAAKEGADVFLVTSKPYLGDDLCATYRYWLDPNDQLENPLEVNMYMASTIVADPLSYSYEYDRLPVYPHWDTWPPSMLRDGQWQYIGSQSVQFNSDVTITADFSHSHSVIGVYLVSFFRQWEYDVPAVMVYQSQDAVEWEEAGTMEVVNTDTYFGYRILCANVSFTARYVKLECKKIPGTWRILLGELLFEDSRVPPVPIQVKKALDEALIQQKVKFLTGSYVTDLIRDQQNQPAGVVIANRSGRQAITAPVIVDATLQATAARAAGVQFRAMEPNDCTFKRIVIGHGVLDDPNLHPQSMPTSVQNYPATEYSISLPPEEDSLPFYAEAEQMLRDRTWVNPTNVQKDASETVFYIPPRSILGKVREEGPWRGVEGIDPNVYCPDGTERFYVLSGYADMSRDCAENLLRPLNYMRAGTQVGSLAAQTAAGVVLTGPLSVPGEQGQETVSGDVLEFLNGARPVQECLSTVPCPPMLLPVWGQYDVIVVGGGTSGAPAAIAAARKDMKTLVIEYQYGLGGVGTLGLIGSYSSNTLGGFTNELNQGVTAMGGKISWWGGDTYWNPQVKMEWYRSQLRANGADIWFGALGAGAIVEDHTVKGVVIATDYGRAAVLGKIVIDSTGNSDIAASAGGDTMFVDAQSIALQGSGLPFRQLGDYYRNTDWTLVDDSDAIDQWRTFLVARKRYSMYYDMGTLIDTRERRRIVGEYVLTPLDILNNRTYPDTVVYSGAAYDSHGFMVHPYFLMKAPPSNAVYAKIPYRCLIPRDLEGILVTGLGISAHRDAQPPIRMQSDLQNMGYAAGLAAARAISENKSLREINVRQLQAELVQKGNLPTSVLSEGDSFPLNQAALEQAVAGLPNGFEGLEVVLTQPETALPLLQNAYTQAVDPDQKLIYAEVLGFLGDATGVETLVDSIRSQPWGDGWVYVAGGWGKKLSELDSQIIALGLTLDSRALEPIIEKLQALNENEEFSHFMAAAFAADALESPVLAPALAQVLNRPGISGNWLTRVDSNDFKITSSSSDNQRRERSFRELLLAKALCQSGDYNGLAHQILMSYENDIRGVFSRFAHDVLKSKASAETCDCLDHTGKLSTFAEFWLMDVQNEYYDFSHDGRINLNDFVFFASEWMECQDWPSSTLPTYNW